MAPLDLASSALASILTGVAFGFVLESSGFADSRRIAAQFYLGDMRVLKVMFTAIVVTMLIVFLGVQLGYVDYAALWVPPTFIWPAIIGGLLLGTGFILGGFCPGTSLTSVATLKIDGFFFVGGMMLGMFIFNDLAEGFLLFFQHGGAMGRTTLMDVTGLSTGLVALSIVLITLVSFILAEKSEARFGPLRAKHLADHNEEQP